MVKQFLTKFRISHKLKIHCHRNMEFCVLLVCKKKLSWSCRGDFHDLSLTLMTKALCLKTIDPHKDNFPDCIFVILLHDIIPLKQIPLKRWLVQLQKNKLQFINQNKITQFFRMWILIYLFIFFCFFFLRKIKYSAHITWFFFLSSLCVTGLLLNLFQMI